MRVRGFVFLVAICLLFSFHARGICGTDVTEEEALGLIGNAAKHYASIIDSYSCEVLIKMSNKTPCQSVPEAIRARMQMELGIPDSDRLVEDYSETRYFVQERPKQVKYRNNHEMLMRRFDSLHYKITDPETQLLYPCRCIADGERFYDYNTAPHHGRGATGLTIWPMKDFASERYSAAPQPMKSFSLDMKDMREEVKHYFEAARLLGDKVVRTSASFEANRDLVIRVSGVSGGKENAIRFVFAKSCDYLPVFYEYKRIDILQRFEASWTSYAEGGQKCFFLEKYSRFDENSEDGKIISSLKVDMQVSNVKLNEPIPDKVFTLEDLGMNIDTVVMDQVARGKNYELGFSGLVKNLTPSKSMIDQALREVNVKKLALGDTPPTPKPRPTPEPASTPSPKPPQNPVRGTAPSRGFSVWPLLAAFVGVSLVAVAGGLLWRTRVRRQD